MMLQAATWDLTTAPSAVTPFNPLFPYDIAALDNGSIAQDVASAIMTYQGEVYYDVTQGMPWLSGVMSQPYAPKLLQPLLVQAALQVPGVIQAQATMSSFSPTSRKVRGTVNVIDAIGQSFGITF